ncbi:LpqN/LpqT family lipoprotein [Gryllotalpicola ginsengisoli]|uniref:LpqN/LpqT family lipoprotein n=1 Tax=Gryllotalpicola ginsengisoli TaxID=444608 RepID=UPI0003B5F9F1|nr:LpqN/LpqT family lipoprotein [Gryllotalpicola ginsengisoli]
MTTIVRSGEEPFPDYPRVSLELPDGWEAMPNPEVIVAAAISEWEGFRPNVCVTVERAPGLVALDEVGRNTWERFAKSPEFEGIGQEVVQAFGGRDSYRMEGGFLMPNVDSLFQICVLTIVPHAAVTDIVYAVGTCGSAQVRDTVPSIRSIIKSAQLLEPVGVQ